MLVLAAVLSAWALDGQPAPKVTSPKEALGFNVGDEYMGNMPGVGAWRDVQLRIDGPAALDLQRVFFDPIDDGNRRTSYSQFSQIKRHS